MCVYTSVLSVNLDELQAATAAAAWYDDVRARKRTELMSNVFSLHL